jgi:tetratricopeptide (TPR) repeat protein
MSVIAIYEPRRLTESDFLAGFVARVELADFLLNQLRQCADGDARHRLILGQRGMGKTSLLRRIQIGIRDDPELGMKLLPLTFREEQYNVRSLDRFWRNCGESLAEWLEDSNDASAAERLDQDLRGTAWKKPDTAAEAFAERVAETRRRPVLLVDNLDLILNALPEQQRWQLRRILQAPGGPILYGAATQLPEQLGDPDAAFYEFFRWDMLDPLTETEMMDCIRGVAAANSATSAPVLGVLQRAPERLRVLHTLTGGNPRILALLYRLLERADSDTVYTDLEGLLDQVTPLYKARVEELRSDLQRAVFDAIALHWDPITTHDLALATTVEVTGLSPQIARLRDFGLIEEVPTSSGRAGYQVGERFFNVWYLMRHGTRRTRQRMRWLTGFLQTFYSGDDLLRLRERFVAMAPGGAWAPLYAAALEAAIERSDIEMRYRPTVGAASIGDEGESSMAGERSDAAQARRAAQEAVTEGRYEDAEAHFRGAIRNDATDALAWNGLGDLLAGHLGRPAEAEEAYRTAVRRDPNFVWGWNDLGHLLADLLGRPTEAEEAFRTAIRVDPNFVWGWSNLGRLLMDHLGRHSDAEEAFRTAIGIDPNFAWGWTSLGMLLMDHRGQHTDAEEAFRTAIRIDPNFAWGWNSLGMLLMDHLGRHTDAEEAFRTAIRIDPNSAWPWNRLGNLLTNHFGRHAEAEEAYRTAIRLDPNSAWPWNRVGNLLTDHLGRHTEAEEAYRTAIRLDPNDAVLWNRLGMLLTAHLGRHTEAEEVYRAAIRIDPNYAVAWINLGILLADHLGRHTEAEEAYRTAIRLDPNNIWPRFGLVSLLAATDRLDEALQERQVITVTNDVCLPLLDATIEVARDNFGRATNLLAEALNGNLGGPHGLYFETLYRLLRLFVRRGYGERIIQWFVDSSHADQHAPIHAAVLALVRGAKTLLDVNPEVRAPAERILASLVGPKPVAEVKEAPRSRRGRPRRRLGG